MVRAKRMTSEYVELHCHSNYSFQEGASSIYELLIHAEKLGYKSLALTDHDNLCGAMEFSQTANSIGIRPITGAEITLQDGSHLILLAETPEGYSNLCNLITHTRINNNRRSPNLDPKLLEPHTKGLILLTGCSRGNIPNALMNGNSKKAEDILKCYLELFGPENVFVELQQNLVFSDSERNRLLISLAKRLGVSLVATNNVHYHIRERHKLQDALVSVKHNKTLEESHLERRPNSNFFLKTPLEMSTLFRNIPEAVANSPLIAERCSFNLKHDLKYEFPDYPVPSGYTPQKYLEELCFESAIRRYGSITSLISRRLNEEFRLIKKHNLAGFFLIYHEIILMARNIMIQLGLSDSEIPLEERSPGRGRGSSVAMLTGYLIGLSHIDPMVYNLSIERFMNDDLGHVPDIDIDFPRNIREELIKQVQSKWGWDHALITGMISRYKLKGCIRDMGKILSIPKEDINKLTKTITSYQPQKIKHELSSSPEFMHKLQNPVWNNLAYLVSQLYGFPKYLAQHPGGIIISSTPLTDIVPAQPGAIENRYICHWDKSSVEDAGFIKIDFLALGTLSQMQDILNLIEKRTGKYIDLSRIDFEDSNVYSSLHSADTIGIFQIESAAQMQTIIRIRPKNLQEMAYEVAAVRPGVGVNNGISMFIDRLSNGISWEFDHPLEKRALERTHGVILFQDQVNQLAIDVGGFTPGEADNLRRAFSRANNRDLIEMYRNKFRRGSSKLGVPESVAEKIFRKFSGQYMFPESHAYAFGITAYQMSWLKYYYPTEFFVAIFNQQPMGFYSLETLKEDAKRHDVEILNPHINISENICIPKNNSVLMGLLSVDGIGIPTAESILNARKFGNFKSISDMLNRTFINRDSLENLVLAGAFDSLISDRRSALWEIGLLHRPRELQPALPLPIQQDVPALSKMTDWDEMMGEYQSMGLHPRSHIMAHLRQSLHPKAVSSNTISTLSHGSYVITSGLVIRRQRPTSTNMIFLTLEDEFGHTPLIINPSVFKIYRMAIMETLITVYGKVSRIKGTMNVEVEHIDIIPLSPYMPPAKNRE